MKNIYKAYFLHYNFYIIFIRKPCTKVELRTKRRPYPWRPHENETNSLIEENDTDNALNERSSSRNDKVE